MAKREIEKTGLERNGKTSSKKTLRQEKQTGLKRTELQEMQKLLDRAQNVLVEARLYLESVPAATVPGGLVERMMTLLADLDRTAGVREKAWYPHDAVGHEYDHLEVDHNLMRKMRTLRRSK